MLRLKRFGFRLIRFLPVLAAVLTSCEPPLPITPELVAAAEDTIPPSVIITSPAGDSVFFSKTVITGKISDHALKSGDNLGSLSSIAVAAGGNRAQKGKVIIDSAGNVKPVAATDAAAGDAEITYNANTDDFTITMDTKDLDRNINIRITALDLNGNSGVSLLNLSTSGGPHVEFYKSTSTEEALPSKEESLPKAQLTRKIEIRGSISNSKNRRGSIDEIKEVIVEVIPVGANNTIQLIEDNQTPEGNYKIPMNGLIVPRTTNDIPIFHLNKNGTFSSVFQVREQDNGKISDRLVIQITAVDKNGRGSNKSTPYTIKARESSPSIAISKPSTEELNYYSSASKGVYVSALSGGSVSREKSKDSIPFEGFVEPNMDTEAEVNQVTVIEQGAKLRDRTLSLGSAGGDPARPKLKPISGSVPLAAASGDLSFKIVAKDSADFVASLIRDFIDDTTPPAAFGDLRLVKPGSETVAQYAKGGDTVNLKFSSITDTGGAGVDFDSLKISGSHDDAGLSTQLKNQSKSAGAVSLPIQFPTTRHPGYRDEEPITFAMSVADNVQNSFPKNVSLIYYHAVPTAPPPVTVSKTITLSPPSASGYLRAGDKIRARFTSQRELNLAASNTGVYFTIGSTQRGPFRVRRVSGPDADGKITYESDEYTIAAGDSGSLRWRLKYVDMAGNSTSYPSPTASTAAGFTVDTTAPTLSSTAVKSSPAGTDDTKVAADERAEVTFTAGDGTGGSGISTSLTQVLFTVGGNTLNGTLTRIGTTNNYRARTRVLTASDLTFQGTMTATVRVFDNAGNSHSVTPTTVGTVTVDTVAPTLSGTPMIRSNNSVSTTTKAGIGNTITVNFTLNEAQRTGVDPTVKLRFGTSGTITVPTANVSAVTGRTGWEATYSVPSTPAYSGAVTLNVEAEDAAGNRTPTATPLSHSFPTFTIDNTAPVLTITGASAPAIKSSPAGADDTKVAADERAEVTFTATDTGSGISTSLTQVVFTVGGNTLNGTVTRIGTTNNYRARTRPLTASDLTFQGTMTATVKVFDDFGNSHSVTPMNVTGSVTVDTVAPTLSSTAVKSSPAGTDDTKVAADERAEVTFTATDTGSGISTSLTQVVFTVGSTTLNGEVTRIGTTGNNYRARTRPLTSSDPQGTMTATVRVFDNAGNSHSVTPTTVGSVTVDTVVPTLSGTPTISSNNSVSTTAKAGIGNTITVKFTLNEAQKTGVDPTVKLRFGTSGTITVPTGNVSAVTGRTEWEATYTVPSTPAYSGAVTLNVEAEDAAGNRTPTATPLSHSFPTFTIDNTAPVLTITGASAPAIKSSPAGTDDTKVAADDRAEVTFTATDTGSGISRTSTQVVFTVGGNTLNGAVTRIGTTNNYRARTRPLTASDLTFQGTMTATVRVFDDFGNSHSVTPTAVTGSVTVDTVAPAITGTPTITSNYTSDTSKAGDGKTITVNFTLSESQKTGVNPTITLQAVTGGNMTGTVTVTDQTPAGSTARTEWRAVYEVPSTPAYSGAVSASISARDGFDNTSTLTPTFATGLTVDNTAPAFTAGPTFDPVQPTLGYTASDNITIEVTGVSSDATSVEFTFNTTTHSAVKDGTTDTWRAASVAVPGSTGDYPVDVKVVDGHGNETNTTGAASIKVQ